MTYVTAVLFGSDFSYIEDKNMNFKAVCKLVQIIYRPY